MSQLLTYGFRDNLLLWLSDLEGNPAITQKERTGVRHTQLEKKFQTFRLSSDADRVTIGWNRS